MQTTTKMRTEIKVADEVWIATALLHRENPGRTDFSVSEIVERVQHERMSERLRPGVRVHALVHCVANRAPSPAGYRMLFATGKSTRRIFHTGDQTHPGRRGKTMPDRAEIPPAYHELLDWYTSQHQSSSAGAVDPLLALRGSGRTLWADEHADAYVQRLRQGWE